MLVQTLRQTLLTLRENWFEENVGIVAATLVDEGKFYSATSLFLPEENKWLHAEAAALLKFESTVGRKPKPTATMIVTLSPCIHDSRSRLGASCTHQLLESGISQVRYGSLDASQVASDEEYKQVGIDAALIEDIELNQQCDNLYALFGELYHPDGKFHALLDKYQNPWTEVKKLVDL